MVLVCVVLTLVSVGGFIHFWGLTIDVVSCINLIIAVGLCVDYAAHVAHNFISHEGSGDERAVKTLRDIGPAVLNGGFSTFLAFILTAFSTSHAFTTFFKVKVSGRETIITFFTSDFLSCCFVWNVSRPGLLTRDSQHIWVPDSWAS